MSKFHLEVENLKFIFRKNGYTSRFIDSCIKKLLNKLYTPKLIFQTVSKNELFIILPYLGKVSLQTRSRLSKLIRQNLPFCKINVIFKSSIRMSNVFNFKDNICKELKSGVVYRFECGSCNAAYYGKTKRHLKVRVSEHMDVSPLTGKKVNTGFQSSAIKDHMLVCDQ